MVHLFSAVKDGADSSPDVPVHANNKPKNINLVATNAFRGDVSKQQLTFPAGAKIVAKAGQDVDSWWWGKCVDTNQKGWFPPAYVAVPLAKDPVPLPDEASSPPQLPRERNENKDTMIMGGVSTASSFGMRTMTNPNLRSKLPDEKTQEEKEEEEEEEPEFLVSGDRKTNSGSIIKGIKKGSKKLNLSRFTKKRVRSSKTSDTEPRRIFQRRVAAEDPTVPKITVIDHQPDGRAQP